MVLSAPTWSRSWRVWRRRPYEVLAQAGRQAAEAGADHRKSTPDPAEFSAKTDIDGLPKLWCVTDLKPAAQPSWLTKDRFPRTRRHPPGRRRRDRQEPAVGVGGRRCHYRRPFGTGGRLLWTPIRWPLSGGAQPMPSITAGIPSVTKPVTSRA